MPKFDSLIVDAQLHPDHIFAQLCQDASPNNGGLKTTAYAHILRVAARDAVMQLVKQDKTLQDNLLVVFLAGPAANGSAQPFIKLIENQPLPEKTFTFWQLIYIWLFTFAAKSVDAVAETRFLDAELSSKVELKFWFRDLDKVNNSDFSSAFQDQFKAICGFLPKINIILFDAVKLKDSQFVSEMCIYGHKILGRIIKEVYGSAESVFHHPSFTDAVEKLAAEYRFIKPQLKIYDEVVQYYLQIRDFPESSICLDWLPENAKSDSTWQKKNEEFFVHILNGKFEKIIVEDITKRLDDNRNLKKKNQFTIVKVSGLTFNGQLFPATNVIMKLRGFSAFRGDINNWIDILKEYMSYVVLHTEVSSRVDYLLEIGPLLLTCEKLDLPLKNSQKQRLIGIFLEEMEPQEGYRVLSSRLKYLTDFWLLDKTVSQILVAAEVAGIVIDKSNLRRHIREIASKLLANKLRVDYCDIAITLDQTGQILHLKLFDFERTSFQELVSERHVILDTIIDLKRRLNKAYWTDILDCVYSPIGLGGAAKFSELKQYLVPENRKRALMFKLLWAIRTVIFIPGKTIGDWLWRHIFYTISEMSSRGYQLIN